jgi:predicted MFS family arabinose efflux permease
VLYISQIAFLPFNHRIIALSEEKLARLSHLPRMLGTALVLAAALFLSGNLSAVFMITLVAFAAVDSAFSMWNSAIISSLMQRVENGKSGRLMGTNGSVTSAGMLIGSIVSGQVTTYAGYSSTFFLSIIALSGSFIMLKLAFQHKSATIAQTAKI